MKLEMNPVVNDAGLALLEQWEQGPHGGPALVPYKDAAGLDTIGYGHRIRPGDTFKYLTSKDDAVTLLLADSGHAAFVVGDSISGDAPALQLSSNRLSALACLVFNIGAGNWLASSLRRAINGTDPIPGATIEELWGAWCHIHDPDTGAIKVLNGLLNRREAEIALWNTEG